MEAQPAEAALVAQADSEAQALRHAIIVRVREVTEGQEELGAWAVAVALVEVVHPSESGASAMSQCSSWKTSALNMTAAALPD